MNKTLSLKQEIAYAAGMIGWEHDDEHHYRNAAVFLFAAKQCRFTSTGSTACFIWRV